MAKKKKNDSAKQAAKAQKRLKVQSKAAKTEKRAQKKAGIETEADLLEVRLLLVCNPLPIGCYRRWKTIAKSGKMIIKSRFRLLLCLRRERTPLCVLIRKTLLPFGSLVERPCRKLTSGMLHDQLTTKLNEDSVTSTMISFATTLTRKSGSSLHHQSETNSVCAASVSLNGPRIHSSPSPRSAHQLVGHASGQLWLFGGEFASLNQTVFHHFRSVLASPYLAMSYLLFPV